MTNIQTRTRMESPVERASWLLTGCDPFTRVSTEILVAFYEHTQRTCPVKDNGEIQIMVEGKVLRFAPPSVEFALAPETKCLGYFNPDDPRFLTLTDGRGAILGTWLRKGLVKHGDSDALAAAIRHSVSALNVTKARAHELTSGDRAELDAMRKHNADFITVAEPKQIGASETKTSNVARTVKAVMTEKQATKQQQQRRDEDERIAREALEL